MSIKPILFSTEMVQAILAGRKAQTRRVINPQPKEGEISKAYDFKKDHWCSKIQIEKDPDRFEITQLFKPTCKAGDILWVRESFQYSDDLDEPFWYKQKYKEYFLPEYFERQSWRPSIHMPKEAARIFLKVTDVRCERLNDISEDDAIAEGIEKYGPFGEFKGNPHPSGGLMRFRAYSKAARAFQDLWESINGTSYPWKSNPWVWVYTFEITEKPDNFLTTK